MLYPLPSFDLPASRPGQATIKNLLTLGQIEREQGIVPKPTVVRAPRWCGKPRVDCQVIGDPALRPGEGLPPVWKSRKISMSAETGETKRRGNINAKRTFPQAQGTYYFSIASMRVK